MERIDIVEGDIVGEVGINMDDRILEIGEIRIGGFMEKRKGKVEERIEGMIKNKNMEIIEMRNGIEKLG